MSRIDRRFAQLKLQQRRGLIPFITAGDPLPEEMPALLHGLVAAGADAIEIGVPFSDPMADGAVIQHASERALAKGVGLRQILGWVAEFRQTDADTPIVLMGYMNPIEIHGVARFAAEAVAAGVDGVLLVDCPVEEIDSVRGLAEAGIQQIFLAAPTTTPARMQALATHASGFVYCVSFAGITGAAGLDPRAIERCVADIRRAADVPVAVGFGIRDAASAAAIARFADAVVIGSALVTAMAGSTDRAQLLQRVHDFMAPIRAALDGIGHD